MSRHLTEGWQPLHFPTSKDHALCAYLGWDCRADSVAKSLRPSCRSAVTYSTIQVKHCTQQHHGVWPRKYAARSVGPHPTSGIGASNRGGRLLQASSPPLVPNSFHLLSTPSQSTPASVQNAAKATLGAGVYLLSVPPPPQHSSHRPKQGSSSAPAIAANQVDRRPPPKLEV